MKLAFAIVSLVLAASCTVITVPPASPTPTGNEATSVPGGRWVARADIPTARSHVAKAVAGGWIYIIGGFERGATPVATVERYDPRADRWERVADLPVALDHAMAVGVGDDVLVFGGGYARPTDIAIRYEARTASWRRVLVMPEARAAGAAVVAGERVYLFGGRGSFGVTASAYAFDLRSERWDRIADVPTPRDHLADGLVGGSVCGVGGRGVNTGRVAECYAPGTGRWERGPDLPFDMNDMDADVVGDALWVVGLETVVLQGGRWQQTTRLSPPRYGLAVAAVGGTLYAITGVPFGGDQPVRSVEVFVPHR